MKGQTTILMIDDNHQISNPQQQQKFVNAIWDFLNYK